MWKLRRSSLFRHIGQMNMRDCGPGALAASIALNSGIEVSVSELAAYSSIREEGATFIGLRHALAHFGVVGKIYKTTHSLSSLYELPSGSIFQILNTTGKHYVVFLSISRRKVYYYDPASASVKSSSHSSFMKMWVPVLLVIDAGTIDENSFSASRSIQRSQSNGNVNLRSVIAGLGLRGKIGLAMIWVLSIVGYLLSVLLAQMYSVYFDVIIPASQVQLISTFAIVFTLAIAFRSLLDLAAIWLEAKMTTAMDADLIKRLTSAIFFMDYRTLSHFSRGDLVTRFSGVGFIRGRFIGIIVRIPLAIFVSVTTFAILWRSHPLLSMLTIFPIALLASVNILAANRYERISQQHYQSTELVNSFFIDAISNVLTIKSARSEDYWGARFALKLRELFGITRRFIVLDATVSVIKKATISLFSIFLFSFGAFLIVNGRVSEGIFLTFNALTSSLFDPILQLLDLQQEFKQGYIAQARVNDALRVSRESIQSNSRCDDSDLISDEILVDNISFCYDYRHQLLRNIRLCLRRGEKIAILGESGAGKSTLGRILSGFLSPSSGSISLFGEHRGELSVGDLRSMVYYVPAEVQLFSASMYENIACGRNVPHDMVTSVIAEVGLNRLVDRFSDGLEHVIGNESDSLSTGERRRLGLARALVSGCPILVLDEITSGLDYSAKSALEELLLERGETIIFMTHDINLAFSLDSAYFLNEGSLMQVSSFDDLPTSTVEKRD